ncbi:MAG: hypothetical protein AMJ62_01080 [Myxococcales bacterium SG8_38]|nr:MAG: hypothetical protein AMJ62_01080 [Myxococcales bacterium SG8_38]
MGYAATCSAQRDLRQLRVLATLHYIFVLRGLGMLGQTPATAGELTLGVPEDELDPDATCTLGAGQVFPGRSLYRFESFVVHRGLCFPLAASGESGGARAAATLEFSA